MTAIDYKKEAFNFVLEMEGGYSNDPDDAGGETKHGISKRAYPELNIKDLTLDDVEGIFEKDFWSAVRGDEIPGVCAFLMSEFGFNAGTHAAVKIAQRVTGAFEDGIIGSKTIKALNSCNTYDFIFAFTRERLLYYAYCKSFSKFGRGWFSRALKASDKIKSIH